MESKWKVKFALHKMQLMVVSRTQHNVTYDTKLTFKTHIQQDRKTSRKLASFGRISWLLDTRGRDVLYGEEQQKHISSF